ncbi:MAG: hydantoinase/oxoprolinase family protein [Candidatus Heimdallarchaeum endolithica]|uniref:Hydantoinase/oxoprolinase family protein n=1 Tax=Candidatus Heimdallarchaeum endolithica TaxID=2876572 RepID=A0A9Y1FMT8_9ARCH|nr:MAG: hydantoinase/oxoprolinase family protein [Candidatus Heimdallarchaeum endolithica]
MLSSLHPPIRIGIDTGGTFTDFIILSSDGQIRAWKTATTPHDPSIGIISGLQEVMHLFDFGPSDIELLIHGTTIGTNAFLEGKCPPIAFLTTKGFKDIIEIGRQQRSDLYNLKFSQSYPLDFSFDLLIEIDERLDSSGSVIRPLTFDLDSLSSLLHSRSISVLAISLLFSFRNFSHEQYLHSLLSSHGFLSFPSFEICPSIGEYERSVTTIINAKVSPVISRYLSSLRSKLLDIGISSPLLIMQSNTGMSDVSTIARNGIQTLYSGLAGGVLAASKTLDHLSLSHLVSLDIGGTSTDVSALIDSPIILNSRYFGGFPIVSPMADVETIGSGGGSIAKFNDGLLTVGPESQGAFPGPACYSFGGDKVTLTDANMVLGYVHPSNFAGNLDIDVNKSFSVLQSLLDEIRNSSYDYEIDSVTSLALSVRQILNHNISQAIRVVTVHRGLDPRDFSLLGFGGAGPMQVWDIARELDIKRVIVPPFPGAWSAYGLLSSDIKHEKVQSYLQLVEDIKFLDLNNTLETLKLELSSILSSENVKEEEKVFSYSLDLRYLGQSDTLSIPISYPISSSILSEAVDSFHSLHHQNYSWHDKHLQVEVVNVKVEARGTVPKLKLSKLPEGSSRPLDSAYKSSREVNFNGELFSTPVFDKAKLLDCNIIEGPAIIDQLDSTTVIPPGVFGRINRLGYIILEEIK